MGKLGPRQIGRKKGCRLFPTQWGPRGWLWKRRLKATSWEHRQTYWVSSSLKIKLISKGTSWPHVWFIIPHSCRVHQYGDIQHFYPKIFFPEHSLVALCWVSLTNKHAHPYARCRQQSWKKSLCILGASQEAWLVTGMLCIEMYYRMGQGKTSSSSNRTDGDEIIQDWPRLIMTDLAFHVKKLGV